MIRLSPRQLITIAILGAIALLAVVLNKLVIIGPGGRGMNGIGAMGPFDPMPKRRAPVGPEGRTISRP